MCNLHDHYYDERHACKVHYIHGKYESYQEWAEY